MKITSSDPKDYLERSGKGLINYIGLNTIEKARYAINNVSMKDLSNMIKDFEKFPYEGYLRMSPNHKPTGSYFYIVRQLYKCMMRAYAFN